MLDLGAVVLISRLRIRGRGREIGPQNWQVELSEDGQNWKPWLTVTVTTLTVTTSGPASRTTHSQKTPARDLRQLPSGEDASAADAIAPIERVPIGRVWKFCPADNKAFVSFW